MVTDLAAKLTIWSKASVTKSLNIISTIGRPPRSATPLATPTKPPSLSGVLSTRSGNPEIEPFVNLDPPAVWVGAVLAEQHHCGVVAHHLVQGTVEILRDPFRPRRHRRHRPLQVASGRRSTSATTASIRSLASR